MAYGSSGRAVSRFSTGCTLSSRTLPCSRSHSPNGILPMVAFAPFDTAGDRLELISAQLYAFLLGERKQLLGRLACFGFCLLFLCQIVEVHGDVLSVLVAGLLSPIRCILYTISPIPALPQSSATSGMPGSFRIDAWRAASQSAPLVVYPLGALLRVAPVRECGRQRGRRVASAFAPRNRDRLHIVAKAKRAMSRQHPPTPLSACLLLPPWSNSD